MKASKNVITVLEHFEGCKLTAYPDSAGIWTIGIGTTRYPNGRPVCKGETCTRAQAEKWMLYDVSVFEKMVNQTIKVPLKQNEFDALLLIFYNVGLPKGLVAQINSGVKGAKLWGYFLLYDKVDADKDGIDNDGDGLIDEEDEKKALLGLVRRRNCEAHLFCLGTINYYEQLKMAA